MATFRDSQGNAVSELNITRILNSGTAIANINDITLYAPAGGGGGSGGGSSDIQNGFVQRSGDMSSGDKWVLTHNAIKTNKTMTFAATVQTLSSLVLGHGYTGAWMCSWLSIDNTNVLVHNHKTETTYPHGLTIANTLQVTMDVGTDGVCHFTLCSNGQEYSTTFRWYGCNGDVYAQSVGSTLVNAHFGWSARNLYKGVWLFGASYLDNTANNRWPYYMMRDGFTKLVIDGYGGESAASNYTDLINLLQISTPKSIIWHPGGNNADTESAINASWLEKWNAVAAICAEKGIELIGVAWPSMYGGFSEDNPEMNKFRNHTYQCAFMRQSGYKYIDLAEAVGADMATGLWYGTTAQDIIDKTNNGMLSSDGVHPTVSGALSMYHMAIACVPELTLLK